MNKKHDLLGVLLAAVTGLALLIAMLLCTFLPRIILPRLDASALVALILAALVLDHYLVRGNCRVWGLLPVYGALVFGLFPLAACFVQPAAALKLALMGAVGLPALTWLFDTLCDRLSTSPACRIAPAISAFGLFLASQCLMGII